MNTRKTGNAWEKTACSWLEDHGYTVLEKNFRSKFGEIDIILFKDNTFIFVEVKYRTTAASGSAEESVPWSKQKKICRTADFYRMRYGITDRYGFRFDVIAFNGGNITHYEDAFPYIGSF